MPDTPERILFLFVDGVGLGDDDPATNPLVHARLPVLDSLLGRPLVLGSERRIPPESPARLAAADATLGMPGLPQSGTGQTALLTGLDAPALFGRHFGPWVPTALRPVLAERNVLRRAADAGRVVAFANAYPAGYLEGGAGRRRPRPAAPPLAAASVGALNLHGEALRDGRAVASSLTNTAWRKHLDPLIPEVTAEQAGRNLARVAAGADLTLFAHYDTDTVGHRGDLAGAVRVLERLDAFLGGVRDALPSGTLLLVASDHGNIERVAAGHTRNPVPVIALGPGRDRVVDRVRALTDVAPAVLGLLGIPEA